MTRVLLVSRRVGHHARASGYDRLAAYLPEVERVGPGGLAAGWAERALGPLLGRGGPLDYGPRELLGELATLRRRLTSRGAVYHFLYGDAQVWLTGRLRGRRNRVLATFHDPPARLRARLVPARLRGLDAALAVGRSQRDLLAEVLGEERVHLVLHGVETAFWQPPTAPRRGPPTCLYVGHYLRDLGTLRAVFGELRRLEPGLRLVAAARPGDLGVLERDPGVQVVTDLDGERLRALYQRAWVTLLPLQAATANNALLESLACGAPPVVSDVGDVRDYAGPRAGSLVPPGDVAAMVEAVRRLIDDAALREDLATAGRARALELDWGAVVPALREVYRRVAAAEPAAPR